MIRPLILLSIFVIFCACASRLPAAKPLVDYVNPFLGTKAPADVEAVGFKPPWRIWGGLTFPGAALPNAMVQLSPVTKFNTGSGYEYEDDSIQGFAHTNKGHWDYCHIPIMPVAGPVDPDDFSSRFSHKNENASPGYYRVWLDRWKINAELTATLRCGFHRYTFRQGAPRLVVNLAKCNENVRDWKITQAGDYAFEGYQHGREKVFFHAVASRKIKNMEILKSRKNGVPVVNFDEADGGDVIEIRIGISFVSIKNAKENLEAELAGKTFDNIRAGAAERWERLLSKIKVTGGTERQRGLFYSCLYRAFMWPALRSDVNGERNTGGGRIARKDFTCYATPALWDDYRNKLVLLGMLEPKLADDVIQSLVERGERTGYMPAYFHGDHAAPFIAGSYLRGLRGFDVDGAYKLLLKNATDTSGRNRARPGLGDYIKKGYVPTGEVKNPHVETDSNAGVTKTLEYAYDDYALALLARELGDTRTYETMRKRSRNYANVFDSSSGLMRGRRADGKWVTPFDPQYPYYNYMYREANAWQSSFFAPHDTPGLIALYPDVHAFERQLDTLFSLPWNPRHIARNINSFIGQYCHGNQPDHGFPYLYYWVGRQEKSQAILDKIMDRFYGMSDGITLCGMDDAGEMSSWYVFNAIGLYPYSPADADYIVTVPLFDEVRMQLNGREFVIRKDGRGPKIAGITCDDRKIDGYFLPHHELAKGGRLIIKTTGEQK